jgi:hypothetical protein
MKTLIPPNQMEVGKVYNLVYVGDNEAYAKINGKRTILVTATTPELRYVQLYDQFGFPRFDDVRGNPTHVSNLELAFKEDEISEPADESEWFKHSIKVSSLGEALEQELITLDDIKNLPVRSNRNPFVGCAGEKGAYIGTYTSFHVEGRTKHPYLQNVYVWWNSWDEMVEDFEKYGVNASRQKWIFLTLKRTWKVLDGANPGNIAIMPPGRHRFVRVQNPFGHDAPWLVLKGTLIGAAEGFWRDWQNDPYNENLGKPINWGNYEVVIEEVD